MTTTTRRFRHRGPLRRSPLATYALIALSIVALVGVGCRAQNSNDSPMGGASAAFSQSASSGQPGLMVSFTNDSTGDFDSLVWDFGNAETSTDPNPTVQYDDSGTYTVSLTLRTSQGTSSATSEVVVAALPTSDFSCTPDFGFVPVNVSCSSSATGAVDTRYEVSGIGAVLNGASVAFELPVAGAYTVTQIVDNGIGDEDQTSTTIDAYDLAISASVPSGSPPSVGPILFSAVTGAPAPTLDAWFVDGVLADIGSSLFQSLGEPGTYTIMYQYGNASLTETVEIQYLVAFGAPSAAFTVSTAEGAGPLDVTFTDTSTGTLNAWRWDFGDGEFCDFPAPDGVDPDDPTVCDSASPTHTYDAIGRYDVTLRVTGEDTDPSDPDLTDTVTQNDAVTVTIIDPGFENQTVASTIDVGWTAITPASATASAEHVALSQNVGGADAGMPTEGRQWAALDGLGTNGSDAAVDVENGIRQDFLRPATASVLEFDYVLLYSEPPAGAVLDAMTATVGNGTDTVEITSAQADVRSPFAGGSTRYPTLDGATTRATPVRTASLDLAAVPEFAGDSPDQVYTLTIRLTNDLNDFRSPRAYVDDIRFTDPATPFTASFSAPATIVAGQAVDFLDETCLGVGGCVDPTSFRWDFGTHLSPAMLTSSGSAEQNPSYTFVEAGDYDVRLLARNADQESLATMSVTVLEAAVAIPVVDSIGYTGAGGVTAPAMVTFEDQSTADPSDTIIAWSWDFAGWGTSTLQNPAPVAINQAGIWTIRLTITTASGQVDTTSLDVVID
ncbi:MAG: PKD domain-containing protein [bacterium]|nr:PKD domain-containing protein [bacterium]